MSRLKHVKTHGSGVSQEEVQPWHRLGGVEHICELRKNSQTLYAIFVTILRMIYAGKSGRTFGCPDVVWRKDPEKTQLWIDTELRWEDMRPDFTPAIFVSIGDIKYEPRPSLDMEGIVSANNSGEREYERTASGTASIVHVCDKAGAACSLADNTENYLSSLQGQISDEYCFDHFIVTGRIPRQQKDVPQMAGKGKYVSSVNIHFDFTEAWTVKMESPILKAVSMTERWPHEMHICGTSVDISGGVVDIQFGDVSSETDTPLVS